MRYLLKIVSVIAGVIGDLMAGMILLIDEKESKSQDLIDIRNSLLSSVDKLKEIKAKENIEDGTE